ncbi:MAG: DUF2339 domain-containing protein [Cytophagales bacterium]|nr:DUF2339 domain-containing protein [Cytophagales bacterium]
MEQLLNSEYLPYLVIGLIAIILLQLRSQRKLLKKLNNLSHRVEDLTSEQKKTNVALQQQLGADKTPVENLQTAGKEVLDSFIRKSRDIRALYPSVEKFIGEQLINKIGIAILVIGVGFFMKYAIDQAWLEPVGRVFVGMSSSIFLIIIGYFLRQRYKSFSSVLIGGGFAIFYFTIGFSYQQYTLISKYWAFGLIIATTLFMASFAVLYNRLQLGAIAIIGGFITPIMVGGDAENYLLLWSYLLILNLGMLAVSIFKKWKTFYIVAYDFTLVMFGGWLYLYHDKYTYSKEIAFLFGAIYFIIFFLGIVIINIRKKEEFKGFDYLILLSANSFFFTLGLFLLDPSQKGVFAGSLAVFNGILSFIFYKWKEVDRNFVFLLVALTITYASLAGPIQLESNYITMFWACEATIFLWLSQRSGIKLIRLMAFLIFFLMVGSLAIDWRNLYLMNQQGILPPIINAGFITGVIVSISVVLFMNTLQHEDSETRVLFNKIPIRSLRVICSLFSVSIVYLTIALELHYQIIHLIEEYRFWHIAHGVYAAVFVLFLQMFANWKQEKIILIAAHILGFVVIIYQATMVQHQVIELRDAYLVYHSYASYYFTVHYAGVFFSMWILINLVRYMQPTDTLGSNIYRGLLWFTAILIVLTLSIELDHVMVLIGYENIETIPAILTSSHTIGYPILWALCSLGLMIAGVQKQLKDLRIASLVLFVTAFVKLFVFDIKDLNESQRIIVLIALGCILLVISFMYQKLKKFWAQKEEKKG